MKNNYRFKTIQEVTDYYDRNYTRSEKVRYSLDNFLKINSNSIEEVDLENRDIANQNQ